MSNNAALRTIAAAAGLFGLLHVGTKFASTSGKWDLYDQTHLERDKLEHLMHKLESTYSGNGVFNHVAHEIHNPKYYHIFKKPYNYAKHFVKDVILDNAIPIGLSTVAITYGLNKKLYGDVLRPIGKGSWWATKNLGLKPLKSILKAAYSLLGPESIAKTVQKVGTFVHGLGPKGILAATALTGLGVFTGVGFLRHLSGDVYEDQAIDMMIETHH